MPKPITGNGLSDFDGIEDRLYRRLEAAHFPKKALGFGTGVDGTPAGKFAAVYVDVDLTNVPDLNNVDVRHSLGGVPTFCELIGTENLGSTVSATARPVEPGRWTVTNVRMAVAIAGAQDGTVLKFRVGGV